MWTLAVGAAAADLTGTYALNSIDGAGQTDRIDGLNRILRWTGRETVEKHLQIGERLAARGDHTGALEQFRRSIELFPTARVWAAIGVEQRALGRWDLALSAFDEALALNPDFFGAHHRRAEALLALDASRADPETRERATASLERALELSPGFAEAALMLAGLQREAGRPAEARRTLERVLEEIDPAEAGPVRRRLAELGESGAGAGGSP